MATSSAESRQGSAPASGATSCLGPVLYATVVTPDLERSLQLYTGWLQQWVQSRGRVDPAQARHWGVEMLAGAPLAWLENQPGEAWLRLVEAPGAAVLDPFRHSGWMSLEIAVRDVDGLRRRLEDAPLDIVGEPANLDVSEDIRAMQAVGPAGEVLYLTEIRAEVPPFELPRARCAVDRLFIPVLLAPDRESALAVYEGFPGTTGLRFDTKIGVVNRARGWPEDRRHPVATVQLAGRNLVEIDEVEGLAERPAASVGLPTGIAMVTLATTALPEGTPRCVVPTGRYAGCESVLLRGGAGEWIELIRT